MRELRPSSGHPPFRNKTHPLFPGQIPAAFAHVILAQLTNRVFALFTMTPPPESNSSHPAGLIADLRQSISQILSLAASLHSWVAEFGPDGGENLALIENSGREIRNRLEAALAGHAPIASMEWLDKDLRHDLRNAISAVSGFAELILMDLPESSEARTRLIQLRQWAKTFVELIGH